MPWSQQKFWHEKGSLCSFWDLKTVIRKEMAQHITISLRQLIICNGCNMPIDDLWKSTAPIVVYDPCVILMIYLWRSWPLAGVSGARVHVGGLGLCPPHVQDLGGLHRRLRRRLEAGPAVVASCQIILIGFAVYADITDDTIAYSSL